MTPSDPDWVDPDSQLKHDELQTGKATLLAASWETCELHNRYTTWVVTCSSNMTSSSLALYTVDPEHIGPSMSCYERTAHAQNVYRKELLLWRLSLFGRASLPDTPLVHSNITAFESELVACSWWSTNEYYLPIPIFPNTNAIPGKPWQPEHLRPLRGHAPSLSPVERWWLEDMLGVIA